MSGEPKPVRPTRFCMADLELSIPPFDESLCRIDHPLIGEAQRLPEAYAAGGAERILSLKDRVWFKVKTGRWRGAATRLPEADRADAGPEVRQAPWWLGAGGYRREGDPGDFYAALKASWDREGGDSDRWMPTDWDWRRLQLEHAYAWEANIRRIVRGLITRSLRDGYPYQAEFEHYRVTALTRAREQETYLIVGTENIADPKVFAIIINAIPGIDPSSWLPEPDGVAGIQPKPGEVIWSTIMPPSVAAQLLDDQSES
ncbi:hypothetical protein GCM10012284_57470 [Mangrovihabitans endophyticus]|uniref:Uncharacterized protein n=2 Tax=Mangrovihabitans endophyticus TaxID=1751298 RepID=A0A8J3C3Y8_9ACTN|nr:hypothetical protein GCM10012284_57470 [Mangrovihabitans endophyticus]